MKSRNRTYEILLVEDCIRDIRVLVEILKEEADLYNISITETFEDTISFLKRADSFEDAPVPDIIFLDIKFCNDSGFSVLEFIKNNDALRIIPCIVLTSSAKDEDINQAYKLKANCYITKPKDVDEYIDIVNAIESFWLEGASIPESFKGEKVV